MNSEPSSSTVIVESLTCCCQHRWGERVNVAAIAVAGSSRCHLNRHHRSCPWQWRRQGFARQSTQQVVSWDAQLRSCCVFDGDRLLAVGVVAQASVAVNVDDRSCRSVASEGLAFHSDAHIAAVVRSSRVVNRHRVRALNRVVGRNARIRSRRVLNRDRLNVECRCRVVSGRNVRVNV